MRVVLISVLAGGMVAPVFAQPVQRWVPIDRVTMGVTGDISLSSETLTFGNGATLHLKLLASRKRGQWSATNQTEPADVYKIDPPANPVLLRDQVLCDTPPAYVVLSYPVEHEAYLSVYAGPNPPKGDGSDHACAGFPYTEG
jgi:hypothetical protein